MRFVTRDEEDEFLADVKVIVCGDCLYGVVDGVGNIEVVLEVIEVDLNLADAIVKGMIVITWNNRKLR